MMSNNKIIYVLTAPYYKTGGTELCHQLVYAINQLGGTASILYKQACDEKYVNPAFEKYVTDYAILTEDFYANNEDVIVIPESETILIPKFQKATIYLWWMSVDNYFKWQNLKYVYEEKKFLRTVKYLLTNYKLKKKYLPLNKMDNVRLHLAQSEYAVDFLKKNGITDIRYLSDFINDDYILESDNVTSVDKENIVIYNPSKGLLFTRNIIKGAKNITFIALSGMSNNEIMSWMKKAKVYIDFGAHPGKDRMPREAAIMGCCIVTGRRGSASFDDVLIPDKYKFYDTKSNVASIVQTINDLLINYNERISEYANYRSKIRNEKKQFYTDVESVFMNNG